jgi:hypothetical protein
MLGDGHHTRLRCLDGAEAPDGLAADLNGLGELSQAARDDYWLILEPSLAEVLDDRADAAAAKFCRERNVTRDELAPSVKACRFLFRSAAALGLAPADVARDLRELGVGEELAAGVLMPCYEKAFALLRQRILAEAVARHGHLVVGFDWRVDNIRTSRKGRSLNASVALLTLDYRDGETKRSITLQLLPDMLEQLRRELGVILG